MSTSSSSSSLSKSLRPGKSSIHSELISEMTPGWLIDAVPARRTAIKETGTQPPNWYLGASLEQQRALAESYKRSFAAQTVLDKAMSTLQDIDTFAEPLLTEALKDRFGVEVDVHKTLLCLRRPLDIGVLEIEISTFEVLKLSLLQATLHNFEAPECEAGAFHEQSGFVVETATPGTFQATALSLTVSQFLSLCRDLDIGAQYQTYVKAFFHQTDTQAEKSLRRNFITSQKAALRAAAEQALLKKDIEPDDYTMILSVIDGEVHPRLGDKQVWFRDLMLMKRRMTGCVVFSISEQYRYTDEFIVYIPHDPVQPLRRCSTAQLREAFKQQFTARDATRPASEPTDYQRFFSQFVAYADRPYYFSQFTRKAAGAATDPLHSIWVKVAQVVPPFSTIAGIKELPPEQPFDREPVEDPYLDPVGTTREGVAGIWSANTDLWSYLYEQNRAKVIADARSHAVPTADVDAKARAEKLNHLLQFGMLGLNMVSMFVPVLGEVMLTVMAGQLLYESFEGVIEWSEGDRVAAKAHLLDVAENLALIGVMAGAGQGVARLGAVKPEPVIEHLEQVRRPDGKTRLWKPDLSAYECDVVLDHDAGPDALGLYRLNGRTFIRQAGKTYETTFEPTLKQWRIKHPTDAQAWQPILEHNGHGAWRHTMERPLDWDRLTLLRRMGHTTEDLTDEQLLKIADASGVDDNALRKMHLDHLPPPPEWTEALRLFVADPGAPGTVAEPVAKLQRACPGLGESAAKRVLADASAEELTRWQTTGRVPLNMLEQARWYVQQRRVSAAFAGLHLESMASADTQWLALHSLEKLPGWSEKVRLEIRDGHVDGPLIDGIGSQTAASRKYLVKKGPAYQAFDERGEELNGIPRDGDNFYASILHALPDEARQALGMPHVGQGADLRLTIVRYATAHRVELARLLEQRSGRNWAFKPPVRINERQLGYYASGRGQGVNPSLTTRVQDVYPALTDQQANGFILEQLRAGKSDAQIYSLLQARAREWEQLQSTLDQWVAGGTEQSALHSMLGGKAAVARNLKQCWRNSPLAAQHPRFSTLELVCDDPLPPLSADFSHVTDLHIRGQWVTDAVVEGLSGRFPRLKNLRINATGNSFSNVPESLGSLQELTGLSLYSTAPYAADMPARLSALTRLEELSVYSTWGVPLALDVSPLRRLRMLDVLAPNMDQWPAGVLELPHLERLNLRGTAIRTLPDGLFEGHERLWSGLSLDWSNFPRENFKPAYEYVKNHPQHLIDLDEMVRGYCRTELRRLGEGLGRSSEDMFSQFLNQWPHAQARFEAIEAMSEQYQVLDRQLNDWTLRSMEAGLDVHEVVERTMATVSLRACWRNGAFNRYGAAAEASVLDLSNLELSGFPELPEGVFPQVQTMYLNGAQATAEQVRGFVRVFSELQRLDLRGSGLTDVPVAPGDLAKLTRLDLSGNRIVVTPAVQQGFEGMPALQYLDLSDNPLHTLDVSAMGQLKAVNLRATDLREWPTGAQDLPHLTWLDLRDSKIASLPEAVLQGDSVLKINLDGAPLSQQAKAALKAARARLEIAKGLPAGALERFAREAIPTTFPPAESGFSIAGDLLPLPEIPAADVVPNARLLQRLRPSLAEDEATQVIERMRANGASDVQIRQRIDHWEQAHAALTRRLNDWLYTRESRGPSWVISSRSRRLGALRILECWGEGLIASDGGATSVLSLNGLQLGDLPELPVDLPHVASLNLTGTRLSAQGSNGFLKAFTRLETLELNGNDLDVVPEPVQSMVTLERLTASANRLRDTESLFSSLSHLERLRWLDLSYNELDAFDVSYFSQLEALDLRNNNLTEWPDGVLDADHLGILNLSGNDITSIPEQALDGSHETLIAGTDLSDNYNLLPESLDRLRSYREAGVHDTVLGISRSDLDEMIDDAADRGEESGESVEPDEELPDEQPDAEQSKPWLSSAASEDLAGKTRIWNQLAAEPDNAAFFHLLSRLQDTREFQVANADLTRRVWTVLEAAASNAELREVLFASSNTHGTCVDGRILTFSALESTVFTHNALLDIPVGRAGAKGRALLNLSRQLFRLDKVDDLASKAAVHAGQDQAEVRLGYRIGLTRGWSDGLDLPGQPRHMTYASGVSPQQLADARTTVMNAERSDAFYEDLIQRDYWLSYLRETYPEEVRKIDEAATAPEEGEAVDDEALISQLFDLAATRNAKLIELSRKEVEAIEHWSVTEPKPGPSNS
ncbi:hypothetical protein PMm318_A38780 [Pseudomonas moorei]